MRGRAPVPRPPAQLPGRDATALLGVLEGDAVGAPETLVLAVNRNSASVYLGPGPAQVLGKREGTEHTSSSSSLSLETGRQVSATYVSAEGTTLWRKRGRRGVLEAERMRAVINSVQHRGP